MNMLFPENLETVFVRENQSQLIYRYTSYLRTLRVFEKPSPYLQGLAIISSPVIGHVRARGAEEGSL
jgi:hypothetical protein